MPSRLRKGAAIWIRGCIASRHTAEFVASMTVRASGSCKSQQCENPPERPESFGAGWFKQRCSCDGNLVVPVGVGLGVAERFDALGADVVAALGVAAVSEVADVVRVVGVVAAAQYHRCNHHLQHVRQRVPLRNFRHHRCQCAIPGFPCLRHRFSAI